MSVTFTKLFASITESTVWCEPDSTRIVWIAMLAMADSRGRVWASIPGLANRARVSVAATRAAIDTFLAPDPDSRTPNNEGRRIEPIDGGWRLLNHEKYRAIRDEESVKLSKRTYINNRREQERNEGKVALSVENVDHCRSGVENVEQSRDNAEAYTEVNNSAFVQFWSAYPVKKGKAQALKAFNKVTVPMSVLMPALEVHKKACKDIAYFPHAATWLNGKRWEDELEETTTEESWI